MALPEVRPAGPAARSAAPVPGHPHLPSGQQPDAGRPLDHGGGAGGPSAAAGPAARRIRLLASTRAHRASRGDEDRLPRSDPPLASGADPDTLQVRLLTPL